MKEEERVLLGRIDGKIDGIAAHLTRQDARIEANERRQDERADAIDARLRAVEQKAAIAGAISGSAVSLGIAIIIESVKQWMARGGMGQ